MSQYKTFAELSADEREELRGRIAVDITNETGTLCYPEDVTDAIMQEREGATHFVSDDFVCNNNERAA